MALGPLHPCNRCRRALIPRNQRFCPPCGKAYEAQRPTAPERGYDAEWSRFRRGYLKDHPNCVQCGATATDVDHIRRWQSGATEEERRALKYADSNLQALCHPHHSAKTAKFDGGFGHARRSA